MGVHVAGSCAAGPKARSCAASSGGRRDRCAADAVLIAGKSAEAEREVVAADGAKALVAAVAAGRISVTRDVAVRPAAERIVAALQGGAPIAVDAPEKRTDGVFVYAVRDGDRRAARR